MGRVSGVSGGDRFAYSGEVLVERRACSAPTAARRPVRLRS